MTGMRVVLAEDSVLLRQGLVALDSRAGLGLLGEELTQRPCRGETAREEFRRLRAH